MIDQLHVPLPTSEDETTETSLELSLLVSHELQPVEMIVQVSFGVWHRQRGPVGALEGAGRPNVVEHVCVAIPSVGGHESINVLCVHPNHWFNLTGRQMLIDNQYMLYL